MRLRLILFLITVAADAQVVLDSTHVPAAVQMFEKSEDRRPLQCDVDPIKPRVDFGFRFQTGYAVRFPLSQYEGKNHRWAILSRVTPEGGAPVFLLNAIQLPEIPKTKALAEIGGSYVVGEGRYSVDLLVYDEQDRSCRKSWRIEARKSRAEKNVTIRVAPGAVRSLGSRMTERRDNGTERLYRITVLVHAAPAFSRATRLRAWDRELLLGTLGPLVELLPAQSVRLVVFNLDQQKTLLVKDDFNPEQLGEVAQALNRLELGTVNVSTLQNQGGHINLLADLINREIASDDVDAVVLLGPPSRYFTKFPPSALDESPQGDRKVFFVQYRPFFRRGAEFPDLLQNTVKTLKGRTYTVHSPAEFANALKKIEGELGEPRK